MALSPFHAFYKARQLSNYAYGKNKLLPVFASSDIDAYPYQIAAAYFVLRSPYLKGAILCDEGSLGKTYEAMLVIAQMWYEGKQNILLVVPTPLLYQWQKIIEEKFTVPLFVIDNQVSFDANADEAHANPFMQEGIILTTYDFAAEKSEAIQPVRWDITVFEEAHHLRRIYTGENKGAQAIREAAQNAFKLLLTATPMQNSIMDLYGLINFIDDSVFPDEKAFYERYFRKPENYPELAERVSKYCFRTTRPQVATYAKIPERIPVTIEYTPSPKEQQLYAMLETYLDRENKAAFPKMEKYDLALMLFRTLSSSTFALERTLSGVVKRLESLQQDGDGGIDAELSEVRHMHDLAADITENAKGKELLTALKTGFAELKKLGANRKALIFTENRGTQRYLRDLLEANGYKGKLLTYNGDKSRDYTVMERFECDAQILIATDVAAEGFNLQFCSFIINYDLPYNTLTIEQRINRCHRQGQQSDVILLNFLNKNNFADVRVLELINKRLLQFSGIFGMSDMVIGNFGVDLQKAFALARTKEEIDRTYSETLEAFEGKNRQIVEHAEQSLFTSFTTEVADKVTVTPQYIEQEIKRINDDLWAVTKYFFEGRYSFHIDEETRTISCVGSPPKVFTGTAMRRNEYSMSPAYQPRSGRHTITGTLARNIISEMVWTGIPDRGTVTVDGAAERCAVGYYQIKVKQKGVLWGGEQYFYAFVGRTVSGRLLSDEECRQLMEHPVSGFTKQGDTYGQRDGISKTKSPDTLDDQINASSFIQKALMENDVAEKEEIARLRTQMADRKAALNRNLDGFRVQISAAEKEMERDLPRLERIAAQKKLNALQKELKQGEQNLFFDGLRLEQTVEEEIAALLDNAKYTAEVNRQFMIQMEGRICE